MRYQHGGYNGGMQLPPCQDCVGVTKWYYHTHLATVSKWVLPPAFGITAFVHI